MIECKICGSAVEELVSGGEFDLFICRECMTVQRDVPDEARYMELYESGTYYSDLQSAREGYDEASRFKHDVAVNEVRANNIIAISASLDKFGGSVLDIGSGNGALCRVLVDRGYSRVAGVDPDPHAVEFARTMVPEARFHVGTIRNVGSFGPHDFGAIAFIDSLEHDLDPIGCLTVAGHMLSSNGAVIVETPDCECRDFKRMGARWKHVKPAEHPFLFSTTSMVQMVRKASLKIVDIRYTIPGRVTVSARKAR